jgi:polysaccharide export outer membrane protein
MLRSSLLALLLLCASAVFSLGSAQPDGYRLAPGDELSINVFDNDDISGDYQVDGGGTISFPLLGKVQAAGRTVEQLTTELTAALDKDYLVSPKVSVEVLNFRPIFVIGQVNAPGSYPFSSGMTVRHAVALAGGYTRRASTSSMTVIRQDTSGATIEVEVYEDTQILPGDTVEIDRRFL